MKFYVFGKGRGWVCGTLPLCPIRTWLFCVCCQSQVIDTIHYSYIYISKCFSKWCLYNGYSVHTNIVSLADIYNRLYIRSIQWYNKYSLSDLSLELHARAIVLIRLSYLMITYCRWFKSIRRLSNLVNNFFVVIFYSVTPLIIYQDSLIESPQFLNLK